tara:strand:+ start:501 stop:728 length:228 start_codon:yes stop_codon:yes gene_type:complete
MARTAAEKTQDYKAAGDSVTLINTLAAKSSLTDEEKATIKRNTDHLEIMVAKSDWESSQSMTAFNKAITDGKAKL